MRLLERILSGKWKTVYMSELLPADYILAPLKKVFAVDSQPVADWLYGSYKDLTVEKPEFSGSFLKKKVCGVSLMKLPLSPLWLEWKRLDKTELGVFLVELTAQNELEALRFLDEGEELPVGKTISVGVFVRDQYSEEATFLGPGYFKLGVDFDVTNASFPSEILGFVGQQVVEASVTFFHCKNVKMVKSVRPQKQAKRMQKRNPSLVTVPTFHVIEIHLPSTKYVGAEKKEGGSTVVAHIVRGHFKRYEGDSKLFGSKNGMWWWQTHVVGVGDTVLKNEYRPWPPEGKHVKKCLVEVTNAANPS